MPSEDNPHFRCQHASTHLHSLNDKMGRKRKSTANDDFVSWSEHILGKFTEVGDNEGP